MAESMYIEDAGDRTEHLERLGHNKQLLVSGLCQYGQMWHL